MKLHFSGAPEITSSRSHVWKRLLDPSFVAKSAPGVESVEAIDPTHYKVISAFGVGAIKLRFALSVELLDIVEPERATMRPTSSSKTGRRVECGCAGRRRVMSPGPLRASAPACSKAPPAS
jgi:carbon monoxide dehydrogenase subunit G